MVRRHTTVGLIAAGLVAAATGCGSDASSSVADSEPAATAATAADEASDDGTGDTAQEGVELVSVQTAAETIAEPPADLVILDVRTPEEFAAGHIEGATMLDFYEPAFADEIAALDRDVPYVIYCRSGSRSGQTAALMDDLGFTAVENIDGGIVAWQGAGLPVTGG